METSNFETIPVNEEVIYLKMGIALYFVSNYHTLIKVVAGE